MKNKNIARHYYKGQLYYVRPLPKKDVADWLPYIEYQEVNETGGVTTWFKIDTQDYLSEAFIKNFLNEVQSGEVQQKRGEEFYQIFF